MAPSEIRRPLDDEVGCRVHGIARRICRVEKSSARTGRIDEKRARGYAPPAKRGLRLFHGEAQDELVALEALRHAKAVLASPSEPNVILRIDRHRRGFRAVLQALLSLGD